MTIPPIASGDGAPRPLSRSTAFSWFDGLDPVEPEELVGLWQGRTIATGHPLDGVLENLGWYGKRFNSDLRADALLFSDGTRRLQPLDPAWMPVRLVLRFAGFGRTRLARNWFSYLQRGWRARGPVASLKRVPFRGKTSAAMAYDRQPIVDHFRKIDDTHVLGVMVVEGDDRAFFFLLIRA